MFWKPIVQNQWPIVLAFDEMLVEDKTMAGTGKREEPHQTGSHRVLQGSGCASWSNLCLYFVFLMSFYLR